MEGAISSSSTYCSCISRMHREGYSFQSYTMFGVVNPLSIRCVCLNFREDLSRFVMADKFMITTR